MKQIITSAIKIVITFFFVIQCSCGVSILSRKDPLLSDNEVVLTFDDGPNAVSSTSERLLDVLKKHNVRAYFCIIGSNAEQAPDIIAHIHNDGHVLVNHSYSDKSIILKSATIVHNELRRTNVVLKNIIGDPYSVHWYRPPYGMYHRNLKQILQDEKMRLLPFSFYAMDADITPEKQNTVKKKIWKYLDNNKKGILLLHDGKDSYKKMHIELDKDSMSEYNRSWIPEFTDSLLTQLERKNFSVVLIGQ